MQAHTLVRTSAEIVTITTLRPGDVYKRLVKDWQGQYEAVFGIVQTVDANGEAAMISSLEVSKTKVDHKVFGTDSDLQIFASTPEEVSLGFDQYEEHLASDLRVALDAERKARIAITRFEEIKAAVNRGSTQAPAVTVTAHTAQEISA